MARRWPTTAAKVSRPSSRRGIGQGVRMAFAAFDVLVADGHSVMGEAWAARRKRLEDLLETPRRPASASCR
jgi:ATP-dependent DNA ligase